MAVPDFTGHTFVAFIDISGFKELMKRDEDALDALRHFYQSGYDALRNNRSVEGFFVSDSGIIFVRSGNLEEKLQKILHVIKAINCEMLRHGYMLTSSIAYGNFDYQGKLEFDGIEKNPIYGFAYVQAFLDNEKGLPKIQPGQCRLVVKNLPVELDLDLDDFCMLKKRDNDDSHHYYYWNRQNPEDIEPFEEQYNNSYKSKYAGMIQALRGN